jgi:hypothetical protein
MKKSFSPSSFIEELTAILSPFRIKNLSDLENLENFYQLYTAIESQDEEKFFMWERRCPQLKIQIALNLEVKISPIACLAYQKKHSAIEFVVKLDQPSYLRPAFVGYALAGDLESIYKNWPGVGLPRDGMEWYVINVSFG